MTTIMYRSFAENMGITWPPDVARVITGEWGPGSRRSVTWAEVMSKRRKQQRERLEHIRRPAHPHAEPCYVWVFFVPGWLYAGWHCYVVTRHEEIGVDCRHTRRDLALSIMRAAPCGFLPFAANFEAWMPAFAKQHPRPPVRDPRQAGTLVGWLIDKREFTRVQEASK